jgi:methylphosphotriester-DNA--protein-cysteine methyltransferase
MFVLADHEANLVSAACEFGVTPFVLPRAFEREVGLSPHAFQQQERVRHAMPLLGDDKSTVEVGESKPILRTSCTSRAYSSNKPV